MLKNKKFLFGAITCAVAGLILMVQPLYLIVFVNALMVYSALLYLVFIIRGERKFRKYLLFTCISAMIISFGLYKGFKIQFANFQILKWSLVLAGIIGAGTLIRISAFLNRK
jgi:hypothetical protein